MDWRTHPERFSQMEIKRSGKGEGAVKEDSPNQGTEPAETGENGSTHEVSVGCLFPSYTKRRC